MIATIRIADGKGRIVLPGFANATVILEPISANEFRVRKAEVIPADDLRFPDEQPSRSLSQRDALRMMHSLAHPPKPNVAARRAAKRFRKRHG